ncbi:MAG TPA: HEAT repeat domain-containing protein [Planctomycetota bacterium]|nr:HEAT repeat domain-containing protein [Planctomycetota bacterium]
MKHAVLVLILLAPGCSRPTAIDRLGADEATAREAIAEFANRGEAALPELRTAAAHEDPLVRRRAKTAIGRITGQWGSGPGLHWKRSLGNATGQGKPIMVLQLFGKFDEEFC